MCTNVIVLHIFIDFSHDDTAQILRATTTPDFWARLVIGLRTVWVAGCSMARKKSARWTLWPCTRTMVSSGFTRSTCLLNCLMPELTKIQKFIKFQLYLIKSYFQFWNFDSPIYLPTYQSASCIICTGCLTGENPPSSTVLSCHLYLFYWPPELPNNIGILIIQIENSCFELCMGNETI